MFKREKKREGGLLHSAFFSFVINQSTTCDVFLYNLVRTHNPRVTIGFQGVPHARTQQS